MSLPFIYRISFVNEFSNVYYLYNEENLDYNVKFLNFNVNILKKKFNGHHFKKYVIDLLFVNNKSTM